MKSNSFTLLAFFCFSFASLHSKAIWVFTPDYFVENGKSYMIQNCPIEVIFDSMPRLRPKSDEHFLQTNKDYHAMFGISEGKLVLHAIMVTRYGKDSIKESVNVLSEVFRQDKPIAMLWFSGLLIIEIDDIPSRGEKKYKVLEIKKGEVANFRMLSHNGLNRLRRRVYRANAHKMEPFKSEVLKGRLIYEGNLRWRRYFSFTSFEVWDYASNNEFDLIRNSIKSI